VTPDVNLLVAASRSDHVHHAMAASWLHAAREEAQRGRRLDLLPMVATGFLRLVTHPKVFPDPTPTELALDFVEALLDSPGVRMTPLGDEWPSLRQLCRARVLIGNAIPDAWIAAAVKSAGLHLVTFDRDFTRLLDSCDFTLLRP
jgi:uncharacterized protein